MSSLSIEERFTLRAPPSDVWSFLVDPEKVVTCLPGATLTGRNDDGSYGGTMTVSLGAVTVTYRGSATFEEVDQARRLVRIVGRGREKSGSGTVSMTMESRVEDGPEGGTAVSVSADVKVAGKIVRFGRGMIQGVSEELIHQFTERLEARVEAYGDRSSDPATRTASRPRAADATDADAGSLALLPLLWRSFKRWVASFFG